ncbi:MAG: response regulator transcription factor [Actinobacteria bacterium]|nr:response regulator transcription factor [Actinomycetota bacterium]
MLLVDDHPLVREGTRSCLEKAHGIQVVGVTGEGLEALSMVEKLRPDVLILDIKLPDISGIEVAKRLKAASSATRILVLTGHDDSLYFQSLMALGVHGYLRKSEPGEAIVEAVAKVANGEPVLRGEAHKAKDGDWEEPLTEREIDVLRLLSAGLRNAEISTALVVSTKTVEFHIGNIMSKLHARSRTEAVLRARELRLF